MPAWTYSLKAQGLSPKTVTAYVWSVTTLETFTGKPAGSCTPEDCAAFLMDVLERQSSWTAATHYRGLQAYYKWAVEAGEVPISPLRSLRKPKVEETPTPVVPEADYRAVLQTCADLSFSDVRDAAILRLFWTTGARLSEVADSKVCDVTLTNEGGLVKVVGKGRKHRHLPLSPETRQHVMAYMTVRVLHDNAALPFLWVSGQGHFTGWGIRRMMQARCRKAEVPVFHPHQLRPRSHTAGCLLAVLRAT